MCYKLKRWGKVGIGNEWEKSMPTLPDYPEVFCISCIKQMNAHKMHLSDIYFRPILGIIGKTFLIFNEFLRLNPKISSLNNAI